MHSTSNIAAPSAAAAYMGFDDVSGENYPSHGSVSAQQIASGEAAVSTGPYPGPVPASFDAPSPASSQGNRYFASVSLPPAAFNQQVRLQDGEDQSVAQSPWNNVSHAVAVLESTQALSRVLAEAILGTTTEAAASEALNIEEYDNKNLGFAALHNLENKLTSTYVLTRKPFDGPVGPDLWLDERNNVLFRTRPDEEFPTFAFPLPTDRPISLGRPVRRRKRSTRSACRLPSNASSPYAPSLESGTSHAQHAVPPAVSPLPREPHSTNKRTRTSDIDHDVEVGPLHKRTRMDMGEVVVLQEVATAMETHEGETEAPQAAEDERQGAMVVAVGGEGSVATGSFSSVQDPEEFGAEDVAGVDLEGGASYPEAVEGASQNHENNNDQTPDDVVSVPAPAPVPAPATNPAPHVKRARRTNAEIATTLVPGLTASICGFTCCGFQHHPTSGDNNRDHIKEKHYAIALLSSANQLVCGWGNCGLPFAGTKMMAHIERDHIGYGYLCPVYGEDCPKHWRGSRAKDQTTHARKHR
ncbi:uncharacterized protein TRAVEDRAFT_50468 [Trametes versicolor FP-101664 SS1]|uniref:uncharacterized protein n=1 Tax=Trametes versicolor (strain FP-101664) TaxID=717944 RepID=UPI00046243B3|nr:uncharacterized protein TRAVEDRAFT_50468 [Trametes versicolor FP-101664 SS1]EIW55978.1 hypothetical protein TRAVEDRAFT_50468 [Trametes versicolor FP-101664 SS1]